MSSEPMDTLWAEQRSSVLAQALGISREEVEQWVIEDYPDAESEGPLAGHIVELSDEAPPALVEKLGGSIVRLPPLPFNQGLEGA
ncbi:hypothetical protein K8U54_20360 [Pseudomonas fulva]|uniref:hypothetical protein n=1 Tax=Pseudomonas fulva TaxID=47880 RepID=UPI00201D80BA|nr:hypothetical protein [Pseudomonas fulva]UQY34035.1 hypothetical protein K8U54_20360 [Pseudomonas fulva]